VVDGAVDPVAVGGSTDWHDGVLPDVLGMTWPRTRRSGARSLLVDA
jgi:hypothetical protein